MHAKSLQSCPTLCDPIDCSLPASSLHGIAQEWVAMISCSGLSNPGIKPVSLLCPALAGGFFTTSATWEVHIVLKVYLFKNLVILHQDEITLKLYSRKKYINEIISNYIYRIRFE